MRSNFRCATPFRLFSTYQPMKPASQSVAAKLSTNLGGGPNQIIEVGQMELTESTRSNYGVNGLANRNAQSTQRSKILCSLNRDVAAA